VVIDSAWLQASVLLWLRLGALLLLTPLFTLTNVPKLFGVLLTLALAGLLAAGLPHAASAPIAQPAQLAVAALSELLVGAMMAFGIHAAFGALHLMARLIDLQLGLGMGGVFDSTTRGAETSGLAMALQLVGVVTFFALGAHHALLRGIAYSIEKLPLGMPFMRYPVEAIVAQFGATFTLALTLGAPVVFAMLLLEAGLAVVARALPQIPVFFVAMPVKLLVGLALLAFAARHFAPLIERVHASIFAYWERGLN
jgi:flagellar biosynthetic protein FliR